MPVANVTDKKHFFTTDCSLRPDGVRCTECGMFGWQAVLPWQAYTSIEMLKLSTFTPKALNTRGVPTNGGLLLGDYAILLERDCAGLELVETEPAPTAQNTPVSVYDRLVDDE